MAIFRCSRRLSAGSPGRSVDHSPAAFELLTDIPLLDEGADAGRQRRHLIGVQRPHQPRRDQHHQLRLLGPIRLALEQRADDRQLAENRNRRGVILRDVVEQPGNRERLPVAQLHVGLGASGRQRRNPEARERDAVGEIERADLRPDLQPDHVPGNRRREVQPDAELLEDDRDGIALGPLDDWNRELAAGEEARFLAVVGNQIRLGEALECALLLQARGAPRRCPPAYRRRTGSGSR